MKRNFSKKPKTKKQFKSIRIDHSHILFEDENYIFINKESGWPVHETLDKSRPNLLGSLKSFIKSRDKLSTDPYLAIQHRLDVDTSGVIVLSKTKEGNKILSDVFMNHKATKKYFAVVDVLPENQSSGRMEDFIAPKKVEGKDKMSSVKKGGKKAITLFNLKEKIGSFYILELEILTGRRHQIRAQLSFRNSHIIGDELYGIKDPYIEGEGQRLHSHSLTFFDELSQKEISIQAKEPKNFYALEKTETSSLSYILFNKPYGVLCQFTKDTPEQKSLADFNLPSGVYPAGRLDKDSEGLLLLSDDGPLMDRITSPRNEKSKTYHVQVEGVPSEDLLKKMRQGLMIQGKKTLPCKVKILKNFTMPERNPPIRKRESIPTCWLEVILKEGRNRQVRRMTAAIGHPTLRLVRSKILNLHLGDLKQGEYIEIKKTDILI